VVFRLDKERFALPLAAIREVVVPPATWTRVPRAPTSIKGVINLRGRVITVVELRPLLDRGRRDLGLLVSDVDGIEMIERVTRAPGKQDDAVKGVARLKGLAVTVLDPEGVDGAVASSFNQ
jgi:purine-binding chemotaxis protein CheW